MLTCSLFMRFYLGDFDKLIHSGVALHIIAGQNKQVFVFHTTTSSEVLLFSQQCDLSRCDIYPHRCDTALILTRRVKCAATGTRESLIRPRSRVLIFKFVSAHTSYVPRSFPFKLKSFNIQLRGLSTAILVQDRFKTRPTLQFRPRHA